MKEQVAKEKLRIIDVIKENAGMVITIGGIIWAIYSLVILPIKQLEYQVGDIINNHLKTIQDEYIVASQERKEQGEMIRELNNQIVRLQTLIENNK
jgi:hypothetical protein